MIRNFFQVITRVTMNRIRIHLLDLIYFRNCRKILFYMKFIVLLIFLLMNMIDINMIVYIEYTNENNK